MIMVKEVIFLEYMEFKMEESEKIIRKILGPMQSDIRPFVCAVEQIRKLMFKDNRNISDIVLSKDVYPAVAVTLDKSEAAISRQVLRIANICWTLFDKSEMLKEKYIGKNIKDINAPRDMFFYFAYYFQYGQPFYKFLECDNQEVLEKEI